MKIVRDPDTNEIIECHASRRAFHKLHLPNYGSWRTVEANGRETFHYKKPENINEVLDKKVYSI